MGLDIYLHKIENFEDTQRREKEYNDQSEKNWDFGGKKELTDEEKEGARKKDKKLAKSLELDEYGSSKNRETIEIDHLKYPGHLFKIGYFRSSYNESGIERKLRILGLDTLHDIFDPQDKYEFQPDWGKALMKTENVIKQLQKIINEENNYGCFDFSYNEFLGSPNEFPIDSEDEALKTFLEEKNKKKNLLNLDNYSNSAGEFFFEKPLEIVALIHGVKSFLFNNKTKMPCTYVIYKDNGLDWYIQSLEIVRDTIKYVFIRADKDKYYLAWSS